MNEKEAIQLLRKYAPSEHVFKIVLNHSKAVQKFAVSIAKMVNADVEFVKVASMIHDIGRFDCPPGPLSVKHGIIGAKILRKEGYPKLARVCERHLGGGLPKEQIIKENLPIPKRDFMPKTIEEKIITYADNLISGNIVKSPEWTVERFRKEINKACARRIEKLNEEIKNLINKNKKTRK